MDDRERERNKLATQRFYFLIVMLILILIFVVASCVLWFITPRPDKQPTVSTDGGLFAVDTIIVEGNTKYREESVVGESGILIGQSVFAIDSNRIEQHLLDVFPYYESVEVHTMHMDEVTITVEETDVVGVIYANGSWVPVGENGKALDEWEISSDIPKNNVYIKGTTPPEGGVVVGGKAFDDYSASLLDEMLTAVADSGLTDIVEIDMTNKNDLTMNWRHQIEIRLGNSSNLAHQMNVVAATIPKILESRGQNITGILNVSSYSNDALENQAVFTPSSILPTTTTASRRLADEDTTQAQTEPTGASEE